MSWLEELEIVVKWLPSLIQLIKSVIGGGKDASSS